MKRKKNSTKMFWFASAAFVAVMLTLSVALYALGSDSPQANAQSVGMTEAIQLQELDEIKTQDVPLSTTSPEDLENFDSVSFEGMDDMQTQEVPEPASITLLSLGGLALLRRKRRNRK